MQPIRLIFDDAPSSIDIPVEFHRQIIEVIIWPLAEQERMPQTETDANGWPIGFFEETEGSLPNLPDRE